MFDLTFSQWISILQTIGLVVGGLWVAYTYWNSRQGQVAVGIEPAARVHRDPETDEEVLLVRLRLRNSSNILFRYQTAKATLLDASQRTGDGNLQLIPFAQEDPFIPLYADISWDRDHIERGEVFDLSARAGLSLEPGEYAGQTSLMAMHVTVEGQQGRLGKRSYWWGTFFYIDPTSRGDLITPTSEGAIS